MRMRRSEWNNRKSLDARNYEDTFDAELMGAMLMKCV